MITIPEDYFVAVRNCQLGFAAPETNNAASEKRKVTIRNWAGKDSREFTFKNELSSGFEISEHVRRSGGWNSRGNVVWRITDPRGFDLEISSANFAKIVEETDILHGRIEQRCVWGRDSYGSNVLIVEDSTPYVEALKATKLRNTKSVSATSIPVGAIVTMKTGQNCVYLGSYFGLVSDVKLKQGRSSGYSYSHSGYNHIKMSLSNWRRRCVFVDEGVFNSNITNLRNIAPSSYTVYSDTTNVSFNTGNSVVLSEDEAYNLVQRIPDDKYTIYRGNRCDIAFLEKTAIKTISYNLKQYDILDYQEGTGTYGEGGNVPASAAIFAKEKGNPSAQLMAMIGHDSSAVYRSYANSKENTTVILCPCDPQGVGYKMEREAGKPDAGVIGMTFKDFVNKYDTFYMEVEIPGKSKILTLQDSWHSTPCVYTLKEAIKALA